MFDLVCKPRLSITEKKIMPEFKSSLPKFLIYCNVFVNILLGYHLFPAVMPSRHLIHIVLYLTELKNRL